MLDEALWSAIDPEARRALQPHLKTLELLPPTPLLRRGQPTHALYFIERGELVVTLPVHGDEVVLGSRTAGDWVGEVTFLEPGPATADVRAATKTRILEFPRSALFALADVRPELASRLVRALSEDLARRVRNAGVVLEAPGAKPSPNRLTTWLRRVFGSTQ